MLQDVVAVVRTDPSWLKLSTALSALDDAAARVTAARSTDTATYKRVQDALVDAAATVRALETELSSIEDVERADQVMKIVTANLTYQAAIQTSAGLGQVSLVDFTE
jgi:flagellin-like hook-associated protein FlgL